MKNNQANNKKISYIFLLCLTLSVPQKTYTIFNGRLAWFVIGHISGLFAAHKHIQNNQQRLDQKSSFPRFAYNRISEYPGISDMLASDEIKKIVEKITSSTK